MNQELIKQGLANFLRIFAVALLGAIAAKYPKIGHFINDWITQHGGLDVLLLALAGLLVIWGQSLYTRMRMRLFAKQALRAEPGTTLKTIDAQVKNAPLAAVLTADPNKVDA